MFDHYDIRDSIAEKSGESDSNRFRHRYDAPHKNELCSVRFQIVQALDRVDQFSWIERLRKVFVEAGSEGNFAISRRSICGERNCRCVARFSKR